MVARAKHPACHVSSEVHRAITLAALALNLGFSRTIAPREVRTRYPSLVSVLWVNMTKIALGKS